MIAQTDGTGAIVEQFGYDDLGHLALIQRGSTSERVVTDPNGSPRLVIDASSGRIVDTIAYDAWGRTTSESAPGTLPFGFGGGLADPDTGLVHFGARDYDPATGRWTASDPIGFAGGDPNLYRYSSDDPVNRTDPSGTASGCYDDWCGQAAWHGGNPHLHGCCGSACIRYCWDKCDPNPNDWFTCTGPYCNIRDCILKWCLGGDTHIYTGDGVHYDFQAAGEFTAVRSADGALEIQVRQEPVLGGKQVTFDTAVAVLVEGDRVGVYADEPSFLLVNGKP